MRQLESHFDFDVVVEDIYNDNEAGRKEGIVFDSTMQTSAAPRPSRSPADLNVDFN